MHTLYFPNNAWCVTCDTHDRRVNIGKTSCKMSYLLNAPYGAVFELDGNKLVRVDGELVEAEEEPPGEAVFIPRMLGTGARYRGETRTGEDREACTTLHRLQPRTAVGRHDCVSPGVRHAMVEVESDGWEAAGAGAVRGGDRCGSPARVYIQ